MVREIIHVSVGQCGLAIGNAFWNSIRTEHHLNHEGTYDLAEDHKRSINKTDVFFQEAAEHRYVPRACLVDLEPGMMDFIKYSTIGKMFKPDNV